MDDLHNAWNKHDIDSVLATVAEQFVYDERPMTMSDVIRGRQAFREYLRGISTYSRIYEFK